MLSQNFKPKSYDYYDYMMFGFIYLFSNHMIIPGSSNRMIRFKLTFQIGFKTGAHFFLTLFKNFFVCKSELPMIISKSMLGVCSQLLSLKTSSSGLDFQFFGSYVGTLFKHKIFQSIFSCICQGNSKSNGGQTLFLPPHIKNWISTKSPTMVQTPFQMPYIIL